MVKTPVYKANSDEKSPRFPEKSRGTFRWFPYGTSAEKVSHNFPENFPKSFLSEVFRKCPEISEKFPDKILWKKFPLFLIFFLMRSVSKLFKNLSEKVMSVVTIIYGVVALQYYYNCIV